eukprot:CAMPEP_0169074672 /NCGR_PEP_ID=MMETSP1015-20121227/7417_1 /TAXON_ID=342587 /ORGANISM="Karlodinium micrum, Strain CCMP2283" /LENGTH=50 /DNA_ID=CAMNT_0009134039 /DNA_START=315 /DNA_END=464 /DNA_ORIENTATION=+
MNFLGATSEDRVRILTGSTIAEPLFAATRCWLGRARNIVELSPPCPDEQM